MGAVATSKVLMITAGTLLLLGALSGCSGSSGGSDDDERAPVGGINGPARVDPDSGSADNGGEAD